VWPRTAPPTGRARAAHRPTTSAETSTGGGSARGRGRAGAAPLVQPCAVARCSEGVEWRIGRCTAALGRRGCGEEEKDGV
jgi:hypothetical protein